MSTDRDIQRPTAQQGSPHETALMLIGVMGLLGGLLTAGLAFSPTQDSPWPGFLAQALIMLGAFSTVAWLVVGALRR